MRDSNGWNDSSCAERPPVTMACAAPASSAFR